MIQEDSPEVVSASLCPTCHQEWDAVSQLAFLRKDLATARVDLATAEGKVTGLLKLAADAEAKGSAMHSSAIAAAAARDGVLGEIETLRSTVDMQADVIAQRGTEIEELRARLDKAPARDEGLVERVRRRLRRKVTVLRDALVAAGEVLRGEYEREGRGT